MVIPSGNAQLFVVGIYILAYELGRCKIERRTFDRQHFASGNETFANGGIRVRIYEKFCILYIAVAFARKVEISM